MAHATTGSAYSRLTDRLNRFPQGAPGSPLLHQILQLLFSEPEASSVALLPLRPFSVHRAAAIWKKSETEARSLLDTLADRGILLDTEGLNGQPVYVLPPPMAGFFEFSMMRVRNDVDQHVLAELFYQYINVEEDFIKRLFTTGETQLGRIFVHEPSVNDSPGLHVLDYDRASEVIKTASHIGIGTCYCRHKMKHLGRECQAPMEICMTFNGVGASLTKHGIARSVPHEEALDLLDQAYDHHLVQFGENARKEVSFICNCCGCCCEAMIAARKFGLLHPVHTTNFLPELDTTTCNGCGKCVDACPVNAMSLVSAHDVQKPRKRKAEVLEDICLGCGVCASVCALSCIKLKDRPARVITPLNSTHRTIMMAIERGTLQHLIFDNHALWSHRAMAAILGTILALPPVKRILASRQMKSRYLEYLLAHIA